MLYLRCSPDLSVMLQEDCSESPRLTAGAPFRQGTVTIPGGPPQSLLTLALRTGPSASQRSSGIDRGSTYRLRRAEYAHQSTSWTMYDDSDLRGLGSSTSRFAGKPKPPGPKWDPTMWCLLIRPKFLAKEPRIAIIGKEDGVSARCPAVSVHPFDHALPSDPFGLCNPAH
jgi:hypothetical protein